MVIPAIIVTMTYTPANRGSHTHELDHTIPRQSRSCGMSLVDQEVRSPDAEFFFVPAHQVMTEAERLSAVPFDVKNVELGHHGQEYSFEGYP